MRLSFFILLIVAVIGCTSKGNQISYNSRIKVKGWNILSSDTTKGILAIKAASDYGINHLQLSHHLIMNLKDVRDPDKLQPARCLLNEAHKENIENVLVWDHALYDIDYYPDDFKTKEGLINLDKPEFWSWFKDDYRSMLDSLPTINGIVLTFIETGAHIEDQFSNRWGTASEKLAHLVDSVASIVIDERGMELYIRTFIYYKEELDDLLGCINRINHPKVKVMTKEAPHDFFLTHPVSKFVEQFDKDVIIEFDLGHEYNGQGAIASILPEITVQRWKYYANKSNVIGYVARTDRYFESQNIGRATEINIYALKKIAEDTSLTSEYIVEEFISMKYGGQLIPYLKDIFLESDEIITSTFYTLGLHMNYHSSMDFEHQSIYSRHCSGKWLEVPMVHIRHGVNKTFHYWEDLVEHLSPAKYKSKEVAPGEKSTLYIEAPWVINYNWVTPAEKMNMEYLKYIVKEKEYGVNKAEWALGKIKNAKMYFNSNKDFQELLHLHQRTLLTAQLYLHASKAYFGYRCYLNTGSNSEIDKIILDGLSGIKQISKEISIYPYPAPLGQYVWANDAERAMSLYNKIMNGWINNGKRIFNISEEICDKAVFADN